jgi:AraC family transcriptional regulator
VTSPNAMEVMLTSSRPTRLASNAPFARKFRRLPEDDTALSKNRIPGITNRSGRPAPGAQGPGVTEPVDPANATMEISPSHSVDRRIIPLGNMTVEIVEATRHERIECRFRASRHLLVVCEQGVRSRGDTFVEGLPRSSLRDLKRKLTFVPAGHGFHEWQEPRTRSRLVYFYFDPSKMPVDSDAGFTDFAPRLYFEDTVIWETAQKLLTLADNPGVDNRRYMEALGIILTHELVRLNSKAPRARTPVRGGLAGWQKRVVSTYIEEHLAEQISLTALAKLVDLSPWYFCRAFKQTFGIPPHRYHTNRRIECAKVLLATPAPSVTDIGLTVGFSETSSFSTAFRKVTGVSPTDYHRSLE